MLADQEPPKKFEKFDLRLPLGLRNRVAEAAKANGRSMNSELVSYVVAALDAPSVTGRSLADIERKLDRLLELVEAKK